MNKATFSLALASLALAASTAYLMNEVRLERGRLAGVDARESPRSSPTASRISGQARKPADRSGNGASAPSVENGATSTTDILGGRPSNEDRIRVFDAVLLRMYKDPQGHRELIEERIPPLRDKYLPLQRRLKVDDSQWLRFMEVIAERELGFMAARADCKATNNCDRPKATAETMAEDLLRIAEVMGDANAHQVRQFERSDMERRTLRDLQQAMPEHLRLSEDRGEEFVMALMKVREDAALQMTSVAQTSPGYFFDTKGGVLLYDKSLPTPEARLESAANYSRSLREQARKYLSGKLFTDFNRQQDELLKRARGSSDMTGP
jgi:hypothetical protein